MKKNKQKKKKKKPTKKLSEKEERRGEAEARSADLEHVSRKGMISKGNYIDADICPRHRKDARMEKDIPKRKKAGFRVRPLRSNPRRKKKGRILPAAVNSTSIVRRLPKVLFCSREKKENHSTASSFSEKGFVLGIDQTRKKRKKGEASRYRISASGMFQQNFLKRKGISVFIVLEKKKSPDAAEGDLQKRSVSPSVVVRERGRKGEEKDRTFRNRRLSRS